MTMHRLHTPPAAPVEREPPPRPEPVVREDRGRAAQEGDWRLPFSRAEVAEFLGWIGCASPAGLPRHSCRLASALRLNCITAEVHRTIAAAIDARRLTLDEEDEEDIELLVLAATVHRAQFTTTTTTERV